jgi:nicotinamide-nucleotide amidase
MTTAEIIAIGNELLIGQTLNTTTHWLCQRITAQGGRVDRAVTVRDDLNAIARELHGALRRAEDAALDRDATVVITTGGLGPTGDDRTLAAIAAALGLTLAENGTALQMIERRYNELHEQGLVDQPGLNAARRKMGRLPVGSVPIFNPVGGAPAVRLDHDGSTIIALPGVPKELQGIWEGPLSDTLAELFAGAHVEREVVARCPDDSVLAPLLQDVVDRHPAVYIKSHVQAFGEGRPEIRVTFSTTADNHAEAEQAVGDAIADFRQTMNDAGLDASD